MTSTNEGFHPPSLFVSASCIWFHFLYGMVVGLVVEMLWTIMESVWKTLEREQCVQIGLSPALTFLDISY